MTEVSALLLAAGTGSRLGRGPKSLLQSGGRSLLEGSLETAAALADEVLVALPADYLSAMSTILERFSAQGLAGGAERTESLEILLGQSRGRRLMVFDVARPRLDPAQARALLDALEQADGAAPVVRLHLRESLALLEEDEDQPAVAQVLPREGLVMTQTPQAFRKAALVESLRRSRAEGWREVSLLAALRRCGFKVAALPGDPRNVKLTYPEDLELLEDRE